MDTDTARVQADFDRLAQLDVEQWDHNGHYHSMLLRHLPHPCETALDVGCGTGLLTRRLALRATHVVGIDLSGQMVQRARARAQGVANVSFLQADIQTWPFAGQTFDCIVSIATLHHLPLAPTLQRLASALKPKGTLLLLDLVRSEGIGDRLRDIVAFPPHAALRLWHTGRLQDAAEVRAAWDEHGQYDRYLSINEVRSACRTLLPGATVRRHLFWRYSIVWQKPQEMRSDGPR